MEVREPSAKYLLSRESQLTELGLIPADWSVSTVGDEFHVQLGKMLDSEKNVGTPKPFLGNRAVQWGRIDVSDIGEIRLSPTDLHRYRLEEGDLLVCEGGEVGRSAIWRGQLDECYYQKALHRLRAKRGYSHELMASLLEQFARSGKLQDYVTQTSIAHFPKEKFIALPIPRPATDDEQHRIASALADADALIDSLEQLLTKKRQIKQGAMQELFNPTRLVAQSVNLEQISGFITKGATPTTYGFGWESDGIVFLRSECVSTNGLDLTQSMFISEKAHTTLRRSAVVVGDLLMTITGNVGRVAIATIDCNINQHIARIRITAPEVNPDFIYHQLARREVREQLESITTGQAYPQLSLRQVRERTVQIPSRAEQDRIAEALSDMDTEITVLEARLTKARALKQAMAQALLTGRIRLVESTA